MPGNSLITADQEQRLLSCLQRALAPGIGALSTFLDRELSLSRANLAVETLVELKKSFATNCLKIESTNERVPSEWFALLLKQDDIEALLSVLIGAAGAQQREEYSDMEMAILEESLTQVAGPVGTELAAALKGQVSFGAPRLEMLVKGIMTTDFSSKMAEERLVTISCAVQSPDQFSLGLNLLLPWALIRKLVTVNNGADLMDERKTAVSEGGKNQIQPAVQPVEFPSIAEAEGQTVVGQKSNIDLIKDVALEISVELGRTKLPIKDVLELATGSVVILDKAAGGSVDLLVNNKLYARGEVVVIDENFGVRVTDILTPEERINNLEQ